MKSVCSWIITKGERKVITIHTNSTLIKTQYLYPYFHIKMGEYHSQQILRIISKGDMS